MGLNRIPTSPSTAESSSVPCSWYLSSWGAAVGAQCRAGSGRTSLRGNACSRCRRRASRRPPSAPRSRKFAPQGKSTHRAPRKGPPTAVPWGQGVTPSCAAQGLSALPASRKNTPGLPGAHATRGIGRPLTRARCTRARIRALRAPRRGLTALAEYNGIQRVCMHGGFRGRGARGANAQMQNNILPAG